MFRTASVCSHLPTFSMEAKLWSINRSKNLRKWPHHTHTNTDVRTSARRGAKQLGRCRLRGSEV